jgi:hypothetical protein
MYRNVGAAIMVLAETFAARAQGPATRLREAA